MARGRILTPEVQSASDFRASEEAFPLMQDQQTIVPSPSPGSRNPDKLQNLRPGQGAETRKKHARSLANKLRGYLESPKGVDEQGRNRRDRIFATLVGIAEDRDDPRAVAAAAVVLDRAYGKPRPSDEELDAVRRCGFQIIYLDRPELADVPERVEPPPRVPHFLDSEIVPDRDRKD
jgi:hypothetical protein